MSGVMGSGGRLALVVGMVSVVAWFAATCSPALAAFPGRNGVLVVQPPASGSGLLLVNASSGSARTVCANALLCGQPGTPRWSPDGRSIVFVDAVSRRPVILAQDGSCAWCLLGSPLTTLTGGAAAFGADGTAVTLAGSGGLWQTRLDGSSERRLVGRSVDDAVWSPVGMVALVRAGVIWAGPPVEGKLRRLAHGTAPSWSPDGTRIAVARGGWIWLVGVASSVQRRLVRGSAPAWSPDGRSLAFIGSGGLVEIVAASGGRPHPVGAAKGVSVDWQPLPASRARECALPKGAQRFASTSEAVVYSRPPIKGVPQPPDGFTVYGCLRAVGRRVKVLYSCCLTERGTFIDRLLFAGRFVAVSYSWGGSGGSGNAFEWYDLADGKGTQLFSGEKGDFGEPSVDSVALDSSGFTAVRTVTPTPPNGGLGAVSCATVSMCVVTDGDGNVFSSTDPTGAVSRWVKAHIYSGSLGAVSCPTASLCVAAGSSGDVLNSTNPTGGQPRGPSRTCLRAGSPPSHVRRHRSARGSGAVT